MSTCSTAWLGPLGQGLLLDAAVGGTARCCNRVRGLRGESLTELLSWYRFKGEDGIGYQLALVVGRNHLSPSWPRLRRVHGALGNDIEPEPIQYVLKLRHLLTHQRETGSQRLSDLSRVKRIHPWSGCRRSQLPRRSPPEVAALRRRCGREVNDVPVGSAPRPVRRRCR
jgi:hypothetical protein